MLAAEEDTIPNELTEDAGLGYLAKERHLKSKSSDYIDTEKAEQKIRIRK